MRYYEQLGLVEVPRNANGHRCYDTPAMERLTFLVRMRSSGLGMADLQRYVALIPQGENSAQERLSLMIHHRDSIVERINTLQQALDVTEYKISIYTKQLAHTPDGPSDKQADHPPSDPPNHPPSDPADNPPKEQK